VISELDDLYQQVIIDHSRRPRNFRELPDADCRAEGYNPLCGDRVTVYVQLDNQTLKDVSFTGAGCAICTSSASLMTESLKGKGRDQARQIFQGVHDLVTGKTGADAAAASLGKLAVFSGVRRFPVRVKCATLPWHTLNAAIEHRHDIVSTE
jgi:nitrogen fixation NifU-like protein